MIKKQNSCCAVSCLPTNYDTRLRLLNSTCLLKDCSRLQNQMVGCKILDFTLLSENGVPAIDWRTVSGRKLSSALCSQLLPIALWDGFQRPLLQTLTRKRVRLTDRKMTEKRGIMGREKNAPLGQSVHRCEGGQGGILTTPLRINYSKPVHLTTNLRVRWFTISADANVLANWSDSPRLRALPQGWANPFYASLLLRPPPWVIRTKTLHNLWRKPSISVSGSHKALTPLTGRAKREVIIIKNT